MQVTAVEILIFQIIGKMVESSGIKCQDKIVSYCCHDRQYRLNNNDKNLL